MRIDTLPNSNRQTQGGRAREWYTQHAPEHLQAASQVILQALQMRRPESSRAIAVLGAGACTEVPLKELVQASDELSLVDLDPDGIQKAKDALPASAQKKIRLVQWDLTGGVSLAMDLEIKRHNWKEAIKQGPRALWDLAADCLDHCQIAERPDGGAFLQGEYGLVVSTLVTTQLFSYPLLDLLDHIKKIAPSMLEEQERHRRYQDARRAFQERIIRAHFRLLQWLLDTGGSLALLVDRRGFAFQVTGTDHDEKHRQYFPLVPRTFPEMVEEAFTIHHQQEWVWITNLPGKDQFGRGYEVAGYVCTTKDE